MFLEPAQRRCRSYDWRGNSGVYESWALHGHHGVLAQHPSAGSRGGAKMVVWCPVVAQSAAERSKAPGRVEGCESALSRPGPTWHAVAGTRSRIASWRRTDETSSAEGRQLSCRTVRPAASTFVTIHRTAVEWINSVLLSHKHTASDIGKTGSRRGERQKGGGGSLCHPRPEASIFGLYSSKKSYTRARRWQWRVSCRDPHVQLQLARIGMGQHITNMGHVS